MKHIPGHGPNPSPICLVGEAPGVNEEIYGRPFVGQAGEELTRILKDARLDRSTIYATNVFKLRPPSNDVLHFFTSRTDPTASPTLPPLRPGKHLRCDFEPMVAGLVPELVGVGAKVVISLGATALWALLGYQKITAYLGTIHPPTPARPFHVIPTYHPSAILRAWNLRTTMVANLLKVHAVGIGRSSAAPGSNLRVKINPTLDECRRFAERAANARELAVDVETEHGQIRTISFSLDATSAFVIPFWEPPRPSYWPTESGELEAWACVRRALSGPGLKIFQNGIYDIQYLWRVHGIPINGPVADTLVAHHALEPELPRSLASLAATYLTLPEWKTMRVREEKE